MIVHKNMFSHSTQLHGTGTVTTCGLCDSAFKQMQLRNNHIFSLLVP